ncbi:MAG: glycosyltransferase family 4 protein [Clostridiaceae bacterium]|nr:glycosyltransferase family 4 protein [Clostridiaceae bacterium]
MKIAFDAQLLFEKQKTGIGWNSKKMIDELIQIPGNEYHLNCFNFRINPERDQLIRYYRDKGCIVHECRWIPASIYNHIERLIPFPYCLFFRQTADVTQFFNYTIPFGVKGKRITIVHDMAYKAFPDTVAQKTRRWLDGHLEQYCRRADIIITVSEFSKNEIIKHLGIPSEKIQVIYNGVDLDQYHEINNIQQIETVKQKYGITGEYLLYLGTLEPRKNLEGLLTAYMHLKNEQENTPKLVIAGKRGWLYDSIFEKVKEYGLQKNVIFPGYIAADDAPTLLSGAFLFIFPSLYEGFGIPPLEAMACGTPVITSNCSSLPEVVGEAAVLIDPLDIQSIKNSMRELINHPEMRQTLGEKGKMRAKQFSWRASAEKLLYIYNGLKMETGNADI